MFLAGKTLLFPTTAPSPSTGENTASKCVCRMQTLRDV